MANTQIDLKKLIEEKDSLTALLVSANDVLDMQTSGSITNCTLSQLVVFWPFLSAYGFVVKNIEKAKAKEYMLAYYKVLTAVSNEIVSTLIKTNIELRKSREMSRATYMKLKAEVDACEKWLFEKAEFDKKVF